MNSYKPVEMKVPIRPAPLPPTNHSTWTTAKSVSKSDKYPAKDGYGRPAVAVTKKKPPPPRPPPPNFAMKKDKKQVPARPSQLITNIFQRKGQPSTKTSDNKLSKSCSESGDLRGSANGGMGFLIDFNSPPSSPTFTTRSSSDCVSVNSFGSDGVTPCSTSSGNTSNVESGFEDDFEFFGGFNSNSRRDNNARDKDPWSVVSHEASRPKNPSPLAQPARGGWVAFPSPAATKRAPPGAAGPMPTIIRVKPERPPKPQSVDVLSSVFRAGATPLRSCVFEDEDEEWSSSDSPPMPTGPPPAPPAEVLSAMLANGEVSINGCPQPHGVALYDYQGQPGDLTFKERDVVHLVRRVDDNWLVGIIAGVEGTVPANYLQIVVDPDGRTSDACATALYTFHPETWDDLALVEGDVVAVQARIDQDWLYGECRGKSGQFPAAFVDHVPHDLPLRRPTQ